MERGHGQRDLGNGHRSRYCHVCVSMLSFTHSLSFCLFDSMQVYPRLKTFTVHWYKNTGETVAGPWVEDHKSPERHQYETILWAFEELMPENLLPDEVFDELTCEEAVADMQVGLQAIAQKKQKKEKRPGKKAKISKSKKEKKKEESETETEEEEQEEEWEDYGDEKDFE